MTRGGGGGGLPRAQVQALIDAGGYQSEAQVQALIDAGGYQSSAQVQALIDASSIPTSEKAAASGVASLDADSYVVQAGTKVRVTGATLTAGTVTDQRGLARDGTSLVSRFAFSGDAQGLGAILREAWLARADGNMEAMLARRAWTLTGSAGPYDHGVTNVPMFCRYGAGSESGSARGRGLGPTTTA